MAEEARVKLRIDHDEADRDLQKVETGFERIRSAGSRATGGGGKAAAIGGAIGGFAGSVAGQLISGSLEEALAGPQAVLAAKVRQLSRETGVTAASDPFVARTSAQQQTMQAFGLGAAFASDDALKGVFSQFQQLESLRLRGQRRIEALTDPTTKEIGEAAGTIARNLLPGVGKFVIENTKELAEAIAIAVKGILMGQFGIDKFGLSSGVGGAGRL